MKSRRTELPTSIIVRHKIDISLTLLTGRGESCAFFAKIVTWLALVCIIVKIVPFIAFLWTSII